MKNRLLSLAIGALLIGGVGFLAMTTDEYIEMNAMTGAIRTKTRYAYVFNTAWKVSPNWVEESATRQGISTDDGWSYLSVISRRPLSTINACERAPASHLLRKEPDAYNLKTRAEIDSFAREFVRADESKRREMVLAP